MSHQQHLILTAAGPDQPGLVEKIAEFISVRDCNIEDSKMAVFCGEFAIILLIGGGAADLSRVASEYRRLEADAGVSVGVKAPPEKKRAAASVVVYSLTASCMDHPGIVYQISNVLRTFGVNIECMETRTYSAPVSGTPLFRLDAEVAVPARADVNELWGRLAELQREQNIDIEWRCRRDL